MKFKFVDPVQVIRPVDPIVFDRIRVGFHQNPTSFIKKPIWSDRNIQIRQDPIILFDLGSTVSYDLTVL